MRENIAIAIFINAHISTLLKLGYADTFRESDKDLQNQPLQ
jgi:hypothetical protein